MANKWHCNRCYVSNYAHDETCWNCDADTDGDWSEDIAREKGYDAWDGSASFDTCPYPETSNAFRAWCDGWNTARMDNSQFGVGA